MGLVPLGYADGIPRHAGNTGRGRLARADGLPVRGRICMDQFVVELGRTPARAAGTRWSLFGPGDDGEPTAEDWAGWCGTIGYEIVTRIGARVPRLYQHATETARTDGRPEPARREGVWDWSPARRPGRGGVALGLELERRVVTKRINRRRQSERPRVLLAPLGRADGHHAGRRGAAHRDRRGGPSRPTGSTLVLVHGYALSLDCWHFQRKHFRGQVRQVLYDQRSHGRSSRSAAEQCRLPQLAEDLAQVLDEVVGDGPVVLVGHSMGGMTIMHLAQTHRSCSAPGSAGSRSSPPRPARWPTTRRSAGCPGVRSPGSPSRCWPRSTGCPSWSSAAGAPAVRPGLCRHPADGLRLRRAGQLCRVRQRDAGQTPLEVVADFYPAFAELDEYQAFEVLGRVPTAVIGGEDDLITPVEHTDQIIELLPERGRARLPTAGTWG